MSVFKILGFLCIVFGVVDFAGMYLGYDLTGVSWSPIVAGVLGGILLNMGGDESDADEPEVEAAAAVEEPPAPPAAPAVEAPAPVEAPPAPAAVEEPAPADADEEKTPSVE